MMQFVLIYQILQHVALRAEEEVDLPLGLFWSVQRSVGLQSSVGRTELDPWCQKVWKTKAQTSVSSSRGWRSWAGTGHQNVFGATVSGTTQCVRSVIRSQKQ
jgi:hypothetical protein